MIMQLKGQHRKGQGQPRGLSMVKLKPLYLSCVAPYNQCHTKVTSEGLSHHVVHWRWGNVMPVLLNMGTLCGQAQSMMLDLEHTRDFLMPHDIA